MSGAIVLDEAKAMNANFMVEGAYSQSRLRQFFFGDATRYILSEAPTPVLLAH